MIRNTLTSYGSVAKFLHWFIALLIISLLICGYFLDSLPSIYKGLIYNIHKLIGILILFLMALRLGWTLLNAQPMLPVAIPKWQQRASRTVHYGLYIAAIGMPLAGWVGSCAAGRYPHIGQVQFILPINQNPNVVRAAFDLHSYFAIALMVLIGLHILAAFYHHFIKRDQILRRMLPQVS